MALPPGCWPPARSPGLPTRPADIAFERHTLVLGANESCAIADINGDGKPDIVSGENWYEGPRWTKHNFRSLPYTNIYIDNFSDLPLDVNGDGALDIVSCSWFAQRLFWSENPGKGGGAWKEHMIETGSPSSSRFWWISDNDGKAREVLPRVRRTKMPAGLVSKCRRAQFVKHVVSPQQLRPRHRRGRCERRRTQRHPHVQRAGLKRPPIRARATWNWHPRFRPGETGFITSTT